MAFLQCTISVVRRERNDDGCDDGAQNRGRHCGADLLPAEDAVADRRISGFSRDRFGSVGGADIGVGGGGGDSGGTINNPRKDLHSRLTSQTLLDSFQSVSGISLESLEKTVFPFASGGALEYRWASLRIQARCFNDCLFLPRPQ